MRPNGGMDRYVTLCTVFQNTSCPKQTSVATPGADAHPLYGDRLGSGDDDDDDDDAFDTNGQSPEDDDRPGFTGSDEIDDAHRRQDLTGGTTPVVVVAACICMFHWDTRR